MNFSFDDIQGDFDDFQATQTGPQTQTQSQSQSLTMTQEGIVDYWGSLLLMSRAASSQTSTGFQQGLLRLYNTKRVYKVGRHHGCDIQFDESRISNSHLTFTLNDSDPSGIIVIIEDLRSSNGTYVNNQRLPPKQKRVLKHGDEIFIGQRTGHTAGGGVKLLYLSVQAEKQGECEVFNRYHFIEKIGSGTFADVKRAIALDTNETVAVKEIQKHKFLSNPKTLQLFEREIGILEKLQHENICRYVEYFEDSRIIYLILEYVDGGNLLEYIMDIPGEAGLSEEEAIGLTRQICAAMAYTHKQGVTHRDLKPENVLLQNTNPKMVKIADFGLAKMIDNSGTFLKSMVGTPQYLAPEVVLHTQGVGYDQAVDSWSVGIIVYAMLTKLLPFSETSDDPIEVKLKRRKLELVDFSPFEDFGISDIAKDFVNRLLSKEPHTRLSLEAALNHPWLRSSSEAERHANGSSAMAASNSFVTNTSVDGHMTTKDQPDDLSEQPRDTSPNTTRVDNEIEEEDEGEIEASQQFSQLRIKQSPIRSELLVESKVQDTGVISQIIDETMLPPQSLSRPISFSKSLPTIPPTPRRIVAHPSVAPKNPRPRAKHPSSFVISPSPPPPAVQHSPSSASIENSAPAASLPTTPQAASPPRARISTSKKILVRSSPTPSSKPTPQKRKLPPSPPSPCDSYVSSSSSELSSPPPSSSQGMQRSSEPTNPFTLRERAPPQSTTTKATPVRSSARIRERANGTPGNTLDRATSTVEKDEGDRRRTRRKTTSPSKV
ncbi:pkinase-domain-containing protein [Phaffia rhodozyma]|uniref:Pkinase-domain-containing protein n=1 Tax=Phaffia rhodozyma TaxID=264483 RepID=A0A0F7SEF5_PHARH|nr:pkinase-domain-containing protein [Phaffia rhodozyma]